MSKKKPYKLSPEAQAILDKHNAQFAQMQSLICDQALPIVMGIKRNGQHRNGVRRS